MLIVGHVKDFENYKNGIERIFGEAIRINSHEVLEITDQYYGENRNIYTSDGGYVVFLENKDEWEQYNVLTDGMLERNSYDLFYYFSNYEKSKNFVRVNYVVNNETIIVVYMPIELFKE